MADGSSESAVEPVVEPVIEPVGGGSGERLVRVAAGSAQPQAPAEQATLTRRFGIPEGLAVAECGGAPLVRCLASSSTGSVMLAWATEGQAEPVQVALDEPAQRMLPLGDTGWVAITQQAATMADPAAASTTIRWTCDGSTVRQQRWDRALVDVQRLPTGIALLLGGSEPELVWVPASCGDPVTTTLSARSVTALRASADDTAVAVTGLRTSTLEVVSLASGSPAAPVEVALPFQPYLLAARDDGRWATLPPNAQEGVWVSLASNAEVTMQPLWLPHPLEHVESCGMYWAGWDAATESAWLAGSR